MKRLPVRVTALFSFGYLLTFSYFEINLEGTYVRNNKKNLISFGYLLTFSYLCARFSLLWLKEAVARGDTPRRKTR